MKLSISDKQWIENNTEVISINEIENQTFHDHLNNREAIIIVFEKLHTIKIEIICSESDYIFWMNSKHRYDNLTFRTLSFKRIISNKDKFDNYQSLVRCLGIGGG